ncbi:MAG TPA: DUF1840 domain-containing protein [Gammaproteobacteria bacterium]|nr:DUF1840 domain-containing protein [Gammaproteobacteria bacterium]
MLVRFQTASGYHADYLESVATRLLQLMEASGRIPGAFSPQDAAQHLAVLQRELANAAGEDDPASDVGDDAISLQTRAGPLITLFARAIDEEEFVMWDFKH